ncbi:MAG: S8 family peptidase, partial [Hyphomicrobiales bacterium]
GEGGGGYPRPPIYHPPRRPIYHPPIVEGPPPYYGPSGDGGGPPPVYRGPRHRIIPVKPVYTPPPPPEPVKRIAKKRPVTPPSPPAPVVAVKQPIAPEHFVVPPSTEARYVPNEVLVEIPSRLTATALQRIERRLGLTLIASQDFSLLGAKVNRYRIAAPRTVPDIVRTLRAEGRVDGAQPNYVFALQDDSGTAPGAVLTPPPLPPVVGFDDASPKAQVTGAQPEPPKPGDQAGSVAAPAPPPGPAQPPVVAPVAEPASPPAQPTSPAAAAEAGSSSDSLQYTIAALHLTEAHRLATGKGIRIAIIDSGIDSDCAEFKDRIVARFDAVGGAFQAHSHGTAIAGAILAHARLVGVAPDAEVIAIRAFTGEGKPNGAEGTSYQILEGLEFAIAQNARIVNMSFAGAHDAMLARSLGTLRSKGVAEIAAAGNGGAKAAPLYPGAEPGVIAVTATDARGQLFGMANHGSYIAVAAPGVDILLPAPGDSIQIASGTSIAAAHVTGIAALALQLYGTLTPDALIGALDAGARKPDPAASTDEYGAGVIDALGVLGAKAGAGASQPQPVASAFSR